ncbi:MAG TPA: DUF3090 domain-containing protein [Candidatus Limnocylindria bacterium]|nr:DUF3090 domain-containing protein [Candidatus Limnocylindria bacterium]
MPRRVYSFDRPDRFIAGAVGMPGQRTFFIQASKGNQHISVGLEKTQVAVLAERIASLLLALKEGGVTIGDELPGPAPSLDEPVVQQFRVGTMSLGWDGEIGRVVIEAREIGEADIDDDEDAAFTDEDEEAETVEGAEDEGIELRSLAADMDDPRDVVRVELDPQAALRFASGAREVVRAGRPPCPLCGTPLDPTGHFCVRRNGHANELLN